MSPRLLFIGVGGGSWQVRGVQIGRAMGARVTTSPTPDDCAWADVIVLVKRAIDTWGGMAHASGKFVVWDALDFWKQPDENDRPVEELVSWVKSYRRQFGLGLVIGATQAMAEDVGGVYLPHHSRPSLSPAPARDTATTVAYEGTQKYLGSWRAVIESACADLGLVFVVNPTDLRQADIVVAFRGEKWDGDICRRWKSGVKIVNAYAAGRPIITQPSAAASELYSMDLRSVVDTQSDLVQQLAMWATMPGLRYEAYTAAQFRAEAHTLSAVAADYRAVIESARKVSA